MQYNVDGSYVDLDAGVGARKLLKWGLDEYAGFVQGGKKAIKEGWGRQFGYLGVWENLVGPI